MKLPNGYGTVSRLSGKRRKPWRACLAATYELIDGKKIITNRPVLGYYRTRSEALQALAEYHKDPAVFNATTLTFSKLYEFWSSQRIDKLTPSARYRIKEVYDKSFSLYDLKIRDITTQTLQEVVDTQGRSYSMRCIIKTTYNHIFKYAMQQEFSTKNPAQFIDVGKRETKIQRRVFTQEEIQKLWDLEPREYFAGLLLILIYTGLRIGELFQLESANIHIEEKYMVGGFKTKAGTDRIIPIADRILPIIKKLQNQSQYFVEARTKAGTFRMQMARYFEKLKMEHKPHDTRYTFASLMDSAGAPLLVTKKIMGHSAGNLTQDLYTKKSLEELLFYVNKI